MGAATVAEALEKNHEVTLLVRSAQRVHIQHPNLKVVEGDVLNASDVNKVLEGQEAVIQALGYNGKGNGKPTTFTTDATRVIVEGMKKQQVNRLIAMSVVGAGNSISLLPKVFTKFILPVFMKWFVHIINDKNTMEPVIINSGLSWTIVRSITVKNQPKKSGARVTFDGKGMKMSITVGDVAEFLVKQLEDTSFVKQAPVISN